MKRFVIIPVFFIMFSGVPAKNNDVMKEYKQINSSQPKINLEKKDSSIVTSIDKLANSLEEIDSVSNKFKNEINKQYR